MSSINDVYLTIREYFRCSTHEARVLGRRVSIYARKNNRNSEVSYGNFSVNYGHVQKYAKNLLDDFCKDSGMYSQYIRIVYDT